MASLSEKIFGTHSERELKRIYPIVDRIEALEPKVAAMMTASNAKKTFFMYYLHLNF